MTYMADRLSRDALLDARKVKLRAWELVQLLMGQIRDLTRRGRLGQILAIVVDFDR
jgi:hypothetical protein